ncbi:MAG: HD domain-containing protein [Bacteroidales bacterium]|nr:HD domain-containing protein [Bacteroidales bacterium]
MKYKPPLKQYIQFREKLRKCTIFFCTILIVSVFTSPNFLNAKNIGSLYIEQIVLNNFGINNNNLFVTQDNKGILYIKNSNGILRYNTKHWNLFNEIKNPEFTINKEGTIYIGGKNQFGYIKSTLTKNTFVSLLKISHNIGQVNELVAIDNYVYFTANNSLFFWTGENLICLNKFSVKTKLFKVKEAIYISNYNIGFKKIIGDKIVSLPNSDFFKKKRIQAILEYDDRILIKIKEKSIFYLWNKTGTKPFNTEADSFIDKGLFSHACILSDKHYAIGTKLSGIIVINKQGKVISVINENQGLLNSSINYLFADQSNNLWALHNHGISRIEIPSAYQYFNKKNGLKGNVLAITHFNKDLYIATSQGVFYLSENNKKKVNPVFETIDSLNFKCYQFHIFNNRLFIFGDNGIYEIGKNKVNLIYRLNNITCVKHSQRDPNLFYLGYSNKLSSIRFSNETIIIENKFNIDKTTVTDISEDNDKHIWIVKNNESLSRINIITNKLESYSLPENPSWIKLSSLTKKTLFSSSKGVFSFNQKKNIFEKDSINYISNETNWIYPIVEDQHLNLWINLIHKKNTKNKPLIINNNRKQIEAISVLPLNRIKDFFINTIHLDTNNTVWFGGFDALIKLDLNFKNIPKQSPYLFFEKILLNNDSLIMSSSFGERQAIDKSYKIKYQYNSLKFIFSTNDYKSEDQIRYKYRLLGYDSTWSDWNSLNVKEYTNLFEGKYTFEVKSKNIFNQLSNSIQYKFEIKPPNYRSFIAYIIYLITLGFIIVITIRWRAYRFALERFRLENIIHERTEELVIQKEKADNLLERVLPKNTANELKSGRKAGPYHYNMVTVLFSDIQGFTKVSEQMDSEHLIDELDKFFLQFDTVVEKYNIEKIKTIGDAYMCAGGIPIKNRTNPVEVVLAAFEMQNFMKDLKSKADERFKEFWDLRIGIDTGPVVAGVLGKNKISYDIWGGTVNTASRMEAASESGKINITENTYMLIKDFFICTYRGKMPVKYKGEIDMYFVEGFKPELSINSEMQFPNEDFFTNLQLLRVNDVEEFILSKLEEGLPDNLYYHNIKHTIDVVTQVELIGRAEGVSDKDILILKTAALFHDMGHLVNYDSHEEEGIKLARKILPQYQYSEAQIEQICNLIQVTQLPPNPKNLLEEIMCDADLDYLGRTDFVPVSISLYKELADRDKIDSIYEWNKIQFEFIKNHQYFTKTARNLREVNKKKQLQIIKDEIKRAQNKKD